MKKKILVVASAFVATAIAAGAFAGCGGNKPDGKLTDKPLTGSVLANFTEGEMPEATYASDGWTNGSAFNTQWSADCVSFDNGAMHLSIAENEDGSEATNNEYFSGEVRTYQYFGYGDYTVKMKPAKKVGTASTFFSYTGPGDEEEGEDPAPHDEIDIEFLGKDTTMVQFNYFVNGNGGHEYLYHLGFDASEEYHEYGYRWTEEYIVWFVDGTPVHKVEASAENPMPSHPSKIFMNYWCGTEEGHGWMGEYTIGAETSDYQWVKCSATPIGEIPEKPDEIGASDIPEEGWENIGYSSFGGWSNGAYTVTKTDGLTVSHTASVNEWKCEGMELTHSYSWVKFNIKNNDTVKANVRLDIKQKGQTEGDEGIGGIEGSYCEDKDVDIKCDPVNYSATITVGGGKSADVVLKIRDIDVNQLVLFLNSMQPSGGVATGSITITGLQGIVKDGEEGPDNPEGDPVELTFTSTEEFTVDKSGEAATEITVSYTDIAGATYKNIQAAAATLAADKNTFSLKIKNNGDSAVTVRVDLIGERQVTVGANNYMDVCNTASTGTGCTSQRTDTEWGGTYVTIEAGETADIIITYSNENDMGAVQRVQLYLDTAVYGDNDTHSGNVTFSNFIFS